MNDQQMEAIFNECPEWKNEAEQFDSFVENEGIDEDGFHDQVNTYFEDQCGEPDTDEAQDFWEEKGWYEENRIDFIMPWFWMWKIKHKYYNSVMWS